MSYALVGSRENTTSQIYSRRQLYQMDDFIRDDETVPAGYEDGGEYFGLEEAPDIDDVIDSKISEQSLIHTTSISVQRLFCQIAPIKA